MPARKSKVESDDILYIGVDLGTSRSAVSASNGKRKWVSSYVGWPKDFVSRRLLGESVMFGDEALENRLSLTLVRPLEQGYILNGTERYDEAVRELLHHLIDLAGPKEGQTVHAAIGVPAEALKVNKQAIREAADKYADSLMIVSEPFAVAYGQDTLNHTMIIDIGAGTVDFCIMHGAMPGEDDQRTLTTAGDFIDRRLFERLTQKYPDARLSETLVRDFKEKHGFVGSDSGKVKVKVPVEGKFVERDITADLRQSCEGILPPIVETMIDLISRYEPEFQDQVRRNIYLAGGGSQIKGLADELGRVLQEYGTFKVSTVKDPLFAGADGALALAKDMPEEYWEEM